MALPRSRGDREYSKFVLTDAGETAVRIVGDTATTAGGLSQASGTAVYYAKPSGANGEAVSAYASATTLTVTGLPFTLSQYDIESVEQIPTSGTSTLFSDKADFSVTGTTLTVTGAAFAATDEFIVKLVGPTKAYTSATTSNRIEEIDPISQHYVGETLIDETNITTNTTTYAYIDMAGVRFLGIQGETSGTTPTDVLTVTLEATCQDDGTAPASCAYQDITNAYTGSASFVDTDFFAEFDTVSAFKYVRVKYVTSNDAGGDADLVVYTKKLF